MDYLEFSTATSHMLEAIRTIRGLGGWWKAVLPERRAHGVIRRPGAGGALRSRRRRNSDVVGEQSHGVTAKRRFFLPTLFEVLWRFRERGGPDLKKKKRRPHSKHGNRFERAFLPSRRLCCQPLGWAAKRGKVTVLALVRSN